MPIHRLAPAFDEQATSAKCLMTGVKVIDLIQPFLKGGKIGFVRRRGCGKTVVIMELINTCQTTRRLLGFAGVGERTAKATTSGWR